MRSILTTIAHGIGWAVLSAILIALVAAAGVALAVFVSAGVTHFSSTLRIVLGIWP